ncbi:hypothetical protein B566_EDAN006099 [Ephemera danica]|nr:hypothetical protein B566_EDAN006099 [Ephemera danica]
MVRCQLILAVAINLIAVTAAALPTCSLLLSKIVTTSDEWCATLTIPIPKQPNAAIFEGWHLKITFSQPIDSLKHNATEASTSTVDDRNFIIRMRKGVAPSHELALELNVKHGVGAIMNIDIVKYNNLPVCNVTLASIVPTMKNMQACVDIMEQVNAHGRPGEWSAILNVPVPRQPNAAAVSGWHLKITFDHAIDHLSHNATGATMTTVDDRNFVMRSPRSDGSRQYDYARALHLSLLFLEAQQSGALPVDNRIPWRGDSCMNDRGAHGEDLTGGYYTGSREYINGMAMVDWGTQYISKCYTPSQDIYAIVGDQIKEPTEIWGRPEDLNYPRPALALSPDNPGSDMFGEMVAALASASVVLKSHWEGPKLSERLLAQARKLFELAADNRGDYLRAMQLLTWKQVYIPLNGDECELIWAATWMYRATSETRYLQLAEKFYKKLNFRHRAFTYFYWHDKAVGAMILLYQMTKNEDYAFDARIFCDTISGNTSLHTSQGIVRGVGEFASGLQLGAWASYACLELGETLVRHGIEKNNPYLIFSLRQINYILGDSGRSFMVGFGKDYPLRPNHIASLCSPPPATCDRALFESDVVNAHVLQGALVFGPDEFDRYEDSRRGVHNNVDIVGNSGLSAALAALLDLRAEGKIF